jgi:hypothetical protein
MAILTMDPGLNLRIFCSRSDKSIWADCDDRALEKKRKSPKQDTILCHVFIYCSIYPNGPAIKQLSTEKKNTASTLERTTRVVRPPENRT